MIPTSFWSLLSFFYHSFFLCTFVFRKVRRNNHLPVYHTCIFLSKHPVRNLWKNREKGWKERRECVFHIPVLLFDLFYLVFWLVIQFLIWYSVVLFLSSIGETLSCLFVYKMIKSFLYTYFSFSKPCRLFCSDTVPVSSIFLTSYSSAIRILCDTFWCLWKTLWNCWCLSASFGSGLLLFWCVLISAFLISVCQYHRILFGFSKSTAPFSCSDTFVSVLSSWRCFCLIEK